LSAKLAWVHAAEGGAELQVWAKPRASRSEVVGTRVSPDSGEALQVRLKARPAEGEANAELVRLLADRLGIPSRDVQLMSGASSRLKRVHIRGLGPVEVCGRLGVAMPTP